MFAAWPLAWDAEFELAARGAFLVSSSIVKGKIQFVQIRSQAGGECRLLNPWNSGKITLYRNGATAETLSGTVIKFTTKRGETIVVVPEDVTVLMSKM